MFPTGSYTNGSHSSNAVPSIYTQHQKLIYDALRFDSTDRVYSDTTETYYWIKHWAIQAQLFALQKHLNLPMYFEHRRVVLNARTLETWKTENIPPMDLGVKRKNPDKYAFAVKFIHIKQGVDTFKILEKTSGEAKTLSLGLQQDRNHKIRVYLNTFSPNTLTIFSNMFNWELVQQVIALIPQIFNIEIPDMLKNMLLPFGMKQYDLWFKRWSEWLESLELLDELQNQMLTDFLNKQQVNTLNNLKDKIRSTERSVLQVEEQVISYYKSLHQLQTDLRYYTLTPPTDATDIKDFLKSNKAIQNLAISDYGELVLEVKTPVVYYDLDLLSSYYKSSNSIITKHNQLAAVFDQIFIKQKYTMITECNMLVSLDTCKIERYSSSHHLSREVFVQPHIVKYNCWGSNKSHMSKQLTEGDIIGAISQAIAATQNINFGDTTVLEWFVDYIKGSWNLKSIQDNDTKEMVSCKQIWDLINPEREETAKHANYKTITGTATLTNTEVHELLDI